MVQNAAVLLICFAYGSYILFFLILYGGGKCIKVANIKFLTYARCVLWWINVCIHKYFVTVFLRNELIDYV